MRALKLLVIGMGVAIVVATAVLVAVIVDRAGKLGDRAARDTKPDTTPDTTTGRDAAIAIPPGFRVAATELSGDRMLVRLEGREPGAANDEIRLLVVDVDASGRQRTLRLILPDGRLMLPEGR
jgi:hypothetical protein